MMTHTPFPTVRRSAIGLLAALLASLATVAAAYNAPFHIQPVDSTVVAGHPVAFMVDTGIYDGPSRDPSNLNPAWAAYQWYRNDVAIPGATARAYRFTAQPGDHGAQYHVVVQDAIDQIQGPTASHKATLTVLAAGSTLPPTITAPVGTNIGYRVSTLGVPLSTAVPFGATGNDIKWSYRFNSEPANNWHLLPAATRGAQAVRFDILPPPDTASLTVRVVDDAGATATRTWTINPGSPPPKLPIFSGFHDSTVVAGHTVVVGGSGGVMPSSTPPPTYQWYRNGVAIDGPNAATYSFTAQSADDGAQYHVVVTGVAPELSPAHWWPVGPTASPTVRLTVLPAGSALPPQITEPVGDTFYYVLYSGSSLHLFHALGNYLHWSMRFNSDSWTDLGYDGIQQLRLNMYSHTKSNVTVRVVDDANVETTRTYKLVRNQAPIITAKTVSATSVPWPGPVTLSVSASDPDGDPLTYVWYVKYTDSVEGGDAVFTPSGASCTATFTKFGTYAISLGVSDGKGAAAYTDYEKITVEPTIDVRADINGDGVINGLDLGLVVDNFGQVVP